MVNEKLSNEAHNPPLRKGDVMPRSLSSIGLVDISSLDRLVRDLGWELINDGSGTLKILLNPDSQFNPRQSYIINRFDKNSLSKECPYQIYLYLKDEGFKV